MFFHITVNCQHRTMNICAKSIYNICFARISDEQRNTREYAAGARGSLSFVDLPQIYCVRLRNTRQIKSLRALDQLTCVLWVSPKPWVSCVMTIRKRVGVYVLCHSVDFVVEQPAAALWTNISHIMCGAAIDYINYHRFTTNLELHDVECIVFKIGSYKRIVHATKEHSLWLTLNAAAT